MSKYLFITAFALMAAFSFTACDDYGKPDPYVPYLGENTPDYGVKVYVNSQTPPINEYRFVASYVEQENLITVQGDSLCKFTAKITMPATERLVVKFVVDEAFIEEYNTKNNTNYILMPNDNYVMNKDEVVIEAGKTESSDSISIAIKIDESIKNVENPMLLPIKIENVNGKTDGISKNLNGITVSGSVNLILDNIDSSNTEIEGEAFNDGVTLNSNRTAGLPALINGNLTAGGYWYPSNTTTYLEVHLPEEQLIKGFVINTGLGSYQFASVRVVTERSSGKVVQGVFATQETGTQFYIRFKEPVSAKTFRFENFYTLSRGVQPDLYEIRLVK